MSILTPAGNVSSFAPVNGFQLPSVSGVSALGSPGLASPLGGALGNNTKSSTPPPPKNGYKRRRYERYNLLSTARYLFTSEAVSQGLLPYDLHRTSKCSHCRIADTVGLYLGSGSSASAGASKASPKRAFYKGVHACGSVWTCTVCCMRIQEQRRADISSVLASVYKSPDSLTCHMVTLTFPHKSFTTCSDLLEKQSMALKYLREGGAFQKYMKKVDYRGVIRSLEITHGKNGWHPHTHELWAVSSAADRDLFKDRILKKWEQSCIKAGLLDPGNSSQVESFRNHSLDIHFDADSSDYMAKHDDDSYLESRGKEKHGKGVDIEVSKSSTKKGRKSGRHPFQILSDFSYDKKRADARLWLEFSESIKGKRQIYIAPKLRSMAGLKKEKTDSEIANSVPEDNENIGTLMAFDWEVIKRKRAQTLVFDLAESEGWLSVREWILDNGGGFNIPDYSYSALRSTVWVSD